MSGAAIVLLSGGLDSVTVLALARAQGREVHALSFRYGQRHAVELGCAARQAARFGVAAHEIVDLGHLGRLVAPASALIADSTIAVPGAAAAAGEIPVTYVPARNTVFLAYALAWAEAQHAADIWIGVNALDYSGYPDCRPEFIASFAHTAALATRRGVEGDPIAIRAPLQQLHKHEIVTLGLAHGVDYADTTSCYDPREDEGRALACGRCDSCRLRREGFAGAGVPDPTRYI
ncbi:MAG: 7-cyano-7-deazaguanine synthase QueC [Deltaproteobacteria bacterium]|nr:7-cyano-7-deazaguanine synthase QueC [Nannocystaceae bacterium]